MKILLLHNSYQHAGGEDAVVEAEQALLESRGHAVYLLQAHNSEIRSMADRLHAAASTVYSRKSRQRVAAEIARFRPEVVHVHNFLPLLSPSVYSACRDAGVPVVQTLHNFRLICPNALLYRNGQICEECLGKRAPWPGVLHSCYRESRLGSAAVACLLATHRALKTWEELVDAYVALSSFAREKLIQGGLPEAKICVKPNFVSLDPGPGDGSGGYALFVGRLSPEKGIEVMLEAWARHRVAVPLKIVGHGPLGSCVARNSQNSMIEFLGRQPQSQVFALMQRAQFLVFPSRCYEAFPLVIAEAFATGLPVLASDLPSLAGLVSEGRSGLLFRSGAPGALAEKVEWAAAHPKELAAMRREARAEYLAKYTADRNYLLLMDIYQRAILSSHGVSPN